MSELEQKFWAKAFFTAMRTSTNISKAVLYYYAEMADMALEEFRKRTKSKSDDKSGT